MKVRKVNVESMSVLINENVKHNKFGYGKIVDEQFGRIDIDFGSSIGIKSFLYPEVFENFLKLENESLQKECLTLVEEKKKVKAMEAEEKRLEQEKIEEEKRLEQAELLKKKREAAKGKRKTKTGTENVKKSKESKEEDEI